MRPSTLANLKRPFYMHDIGMMFLAEAAWLKSAKMTAEDRRALHLHPDYAAGLLSRMAGWSEAAEMVAQHHEMADGKGYPRGLPVAGICPGASLLGIVDAFESVMLKHDHCGRKRAVLLAIAEINACDRQFAPEWIAPFNQVVRRLLEIRVSQEIDDPGPAASAVLPVFTAPTRCAPSVTPMSPSSALAVSDPGQWKRLPALASAGSP